ncbi:Na/Pi cotransporter family protein [Scytonema sp. PCC 10023]|uniref:Na/Pi cotransporter family protein n=1 Tax=Scytonema sp. PCC 10023 TaxID=1680591 RepID=UPI0039C67DFB
MNSELPFLGSSSVEFSVNAQTVQAERTQGDIKVEIAQAPPAPSGSEQASKEKKGVINFFQMAMGAIAGLVLFIYGVTRLSEGLEDIGTDRMKNLLSKFTTNRFAGVGTGIVATTLLESSSVTIILVIAMVSAGVLTFVQSLGVVLGSNIGTAVGAQIISLDIEQYVPILMFLGLLVLFLGKTGTQKNIGLILLGFGLMFYGLEAIDEAMKPFRNYQPFIDLMRTLGNNPLLGAIVGAIFTVVIQSSSATVAIVITLAGSGLVSLPAGIAIMLGAEVGTCADTLVATIGRGRPALRTGVFHFLFNLISAILGIIFAPLLAQLVLAISGENVGRQIANAQIIFNLIGVTAVILFLPIIARGLERLIPNAPDNKPEKQLKTASNK